MPAQTCTFMGASVFLSILVVPTFEESIVYCDSLTELSIHPWRWRYRTVRSLAGTFGWISGVLLCLALWLIDTISSWRTTSRCMTFHEKTAIRALMDFGVDEVQQLNGYSLQWSSWFWGILECLPLWYYFRNLMTLQRLIFLPSSERTRTIWEGPFPFDRSVSILVFFSCVSMAMHTQSLQRCSSGKTCLNWKPLLRQPPQQKIWPCAILSLLGTLSHTTLAFITLT